MSTLSYAFVPFAFVPSPLLSFLFLVWCWSLGECKAGGCKALCHDAASSLFRVCASMFVSMCRGWLRRRQRIWSFRTLCCICVRGTRRLGWFYCRCSSSSCFVWCRRARGSCTVCFWSIALALPSRCPSSEYSQYSLVRQPQLFLKTLSAPLACMPL